MHNVSASVEKDVLVLRIKIGAGDIKAAPPSKTGKTVLVGTTSGTAPVPDRPGLSYALNVMAKPGGSASGGNAG